MNKILKRVQELESYVYSLAGKLDKDLIKNFRIAYSDERLTGIYLAICINTRDPLQRNRVQFFTSLISDDKSNLTSLPWANPISTFGGFDDAGVTWVPPAGSTIVVVFANGNRNSAFYLGSVHPVSTGKYGWRGIAVPEYDTIWNTENGKRDGYLVGPDDGTQMLPPWTSENYHSIDPLQFTTIDDDFKSIEGVGYANIYGIKTPGKYRIKFVDGDPRCNYRWSRGEIASGRGNIILFKDDHLTPSGQWANPNASKGVSEGGASCPFDETFNTTNATGTTCGSSSNAPNEEDLNKGANPNYKRKEESRLYEGAPNQQNNASALPQSGIQIQSLSGHQTVYDDSVEEPNGVPNWKLDFDFGCTDLFKGKMYHKSATGHKIALDDKESETGIRDDGNGIELLTACGNKISLNDHTVGKGEDGANSEGSVPLQSCPPNQAGENRGITLETTSKHSFKMIDEGNTQCSPERKEGGEPVAKASGAYCKLVTGYGLQMIFDDGDDQEKTVNQAIQFLCLDKDKPEKSHIFRMEVAGSPESSSSSSESGMVFLRSGGILVTQAQGDSIEIVGSQDEKASKIVEVSGDYATICDNMLTESQTNMLFFAKEKIFILAGEDCDSTTTNEKAPCLANAVIYQDGVLKISDRIYLSGSSGSQRVTLPMVFGGKKQQEQ